MRHQAVITGIGALTPIGNGATQFGRGLLAGCDGIAPIRGFDATRHRFGLAGELKGFDPAEHFDAAELPHLSRGSQMIRVASAEALADADLDLSREDRSAIAVVLATDLGGMPASVDGYRALHHPYRRGRAQAGDAWRSLLLEGSIASIADQLAWHLGLSGRSLVVSTACSAGLHAIGIGSDAIRRGEADLAIVGGVDPLSEMPQAGFGVLRSLAAARIRPFDRTRDGTLLGEAAAVLVLESARHAARRGARVWAEVVGYGASTDALHMTRPDDSGHGPARAIRAALEDAAVQPEEIDYIKAHGTATPANDVTETRAIKLVFGREPRVPVSSIKSMIGHSLGASGAVETVAALLAMQGGFVPPTLNLDTPDPECDLDYVPGRSRPLDVRTVLVNAFGFGGNNAALVLRRGEDA